MFCKSILSSSMCSSSIMDLMRSMRRLKLSSLNRKRVPSVEDKFIVLSLKTLEADLFTL